MFLLVLVELSRTKKRKVKQQRNFEDSKQLQPTNIRGSKYAKGQSRGLNHARWMGTPRENQARRRESSSKKKAITYHNFYFLCNSLQY
ncbi:putative G-protein coupled receptor [Sesbania bispinosa]|nr:putative G-protein coupled receptor [Sesbania bispinosa]